MIDARFEAWLDEASCADRCLAADRLCGLVVENVGDTVGHGLGGLLERLAIDPSPKVRAVLADRLGGSQRAPLTVIRLLCEDIEAIAAQVAGRSPRLGTDDLLHLVATGSTAIRAAIAQRPRLCERLAEAISASQDAVACRALLQNAQASLDPGMLRQIADLAEEDPTLREALIRRPDLPADLRQSLMLSVARTLRATPFVQQMLGASVQRVAAESCDAATLSIARRVPASDLVAFSDELRRRGQVSTILLVRTACSGELDFFAAALAALSGLTYQRVRTTIVDARDGPFRALLASAGVPAPAQTLLLVAVRTWKHAIASGADASDAGAIVQVLDEIMAAVRQTQCRESAELSHVLSRLRSAALRASVVRRPAIKLAA